jgi:hypothetical protein
LNRSVFNQFGLFNPYLISFCDMEYWTRIGTNAGIVYIPKTLAHFRRHRMGTTFVDEQSRKFRMHIDTLVWIHEFLFHPLYEQLRYYASQCRPPVDFNQLLASKVKAAWKSARQAAKDPSNPDTTLIDAMNEITSLFPGLKVVKKFPFSLRFQKYRWKAKMHLSNLLKN